MVNWTAQFLACKLLHDHMIIRVAYQAASLGSPSEILSGLVRGLVLLTCRSTRISLLVARQLAIKSFDKVVGTALVAFPTTLLLIIRYSCLEARIETLDFTAFVDQISALEIRASIIDDHLCTDSKV